jgi:mRNA-degrading endonuclease RelE of RelBE toxin-antitoxin system
VVGPPRGVSDLYQIDDEARIVRVTAVRHRSDAYQS